MTILYLLMMFWWTSLDAIFKPDTSIMSSLWHGVAWPFFVTRWLLTGKF